MEQIMKQYQSRNHITTSYVVQRTIKQQIIANAVARYVPKQLVYVDSTKNAKQIQNSIVNLQYCQPDQQMVNINKIQQLKINPTAFKVKRKIMNSKLPSRGHAKNNRDINQFVKLENRRNSILKHIQSRRQSINRPLYGQILQQNNGIKSQMRLFPSASAHQMDRGIKKFADVQKLKYNQNLTKDIDESDQIIKELRQKANLSQLFSSALGKLNPTKKEIQKQSNKKSKDSQPKGIILTTDYDGCWVNINKNDLNRQTPHYINVQTEVLQNDPSQNIKRNSLSFRQSSDYKKQINFKQLKIVDRESFFLQNTIKKVQSLQRSRKQFCYQYFSDKKYQDSFSPQAQIKSIGKIYKPIKVGFNVFQRMKKVGWKIKQSQQTKKQQQNPKPNIMDQVRKKTQIFNIKQNKQNLNQTTTKLSNSQPSFKNHSNINLANMNAFNFLINVDRKSCKKKVTIKQDNQ